MLHALVAESFRLYGSDTTAIVVNDIKRLGFRYVTQLGIAVSATDIPHPQSKWETIRSLYQNQQYDNFIRVAAGPANAGL